MPDLCFRREEVNSRNNGMGVYCLVRKDERKKGKESRIAHMEPARNEV